MLDPVLRDAERAFSQSGAGTDAARVLAARLRAGAVDAARVRAAALLDDAVAVAVVGVQVAPPDPPGWVVPPGVAPGSTLGWALGAANALGAGVERDELIVRAALAALDATWAAWQARFDDTERLQRFRTRARAWIAAPTPGDADLLWKAVPVIDDAAWLTSDDAVRAAVRAALLPWLLGGA